MNILLIEAFYSGSHKQWADQLAQHSRHNITLLTLPGKFWKWRMYGASVTFAEQVSILDVIPDLILTTDMLDIATFIALTRPYLPQDLPIVTYFHENQFAYPWQTNSEDIKHKRDVHFGMTNYTTALASDYLMFNSSYNLESFLSGLGKTLDKMPDYKHKDTLDSIKEKSTIMPLGFNFEKLNTKEEDDIKQDRTPIILWNHRLDHDKNPQEFFNLLIKLQKNGTPFQLVFLGEQSNKQLALYKESFDQLKSNILHMGYCDLSTYKKYLHMADLLPVTSIHDFFGISIAEAIYTGTKPLLPKRLSYVDLYHPDKHPEIFYNDEEDLFQKVMSFCQNYPSSKTNYQSLVKDYDWRLMINQYDDFFEMVKN